jgi:hypothetical protein
VSDALHGLLKNDGDKTAEAESQSGKNPNGTGCDPAVEDVDRRLRCANDNNRNQINFMAANLCSDSKRRSV